MQKELEQTRMKFSLASQEIISLKAAAQQAQREKEQVMLSSSSALPLSFIYKSIIKKKKRNDKEKTNSNHHVWFAPFQRSECSLTSFKHQLKAVSFQESYHIRVISCTGNLNKFLLLFILCCTEIFALLATL